MSEVYILNVWDETQGKYIGIPAIKGDKGEKGDMPTVPIANENTLGVVMPVAKTDAMSQPVGVDANGRLYVESSEGPWRFLGLFTTTDDVETFEVTTDSEGKPFSLKSIRMLIITQPPENLVNSGSDIPNVTSFEAWLVYGDNNMLEVAGYNHGGYCGKSAPDDYTESDTRDIRSSIDYWTGSPISRVLFVRRDPFKYGSGEWAEGIYEGDYVHCYIGKGTLVKIWGIDA